MGPTWGPPGSCRPQMGPMLVREPCYQGWLTNAIIFVLRLPLLWRYNERNGVPNHQPHDCLLSRLFRRRSDKTSKFRVTGLCAGNSPETGEFPAQRASIAENVSIWWRHHALPSCHSSAYHFRWGKLWWHHNWVLKKRCRTLLWCITGLW